MISYETYCKIKQYRDERHLSAHQIAQALSIDVKTVNRWLVTPGYQARQGSKRSSKLDAYKKLIIAWLETHPYSATQIYQRLKESGFDGGITIVTDYVRRVRPTPAPAFLKLSFEPGEAAQVDWGEWGSVAVGNTRRRLSFFVMVLCYSRLMYLEFTVSQTMEHFLGCHQRAFEAMGRIPEKVMVDNLRSAVLKRLMGEAPIFNPRYRDFADHYGFTIVACAVGKGNEKGRVENAVGYVKKNLLNGLDIASFDALNAAAKIWMDTIANVRIHGETRERPIDRYQQEVQQLHVLPAVPFDIGTVHQLRANNQFRVTLDTNRYSIPAEYASQRVILKAYPDRLFIFHQDKLIAQHVRCYDRHQDFELPDHPKALLAQRRHAREQRIYARFLALSPDAEAYYQGLVDKRLNVRDHLRKIVALSEIYAPDEVARVLRDCLHLQAFNADYVANLLEQRQRILPEPGALHLTRAQDLLELELQEPDLSAYEPKTPVALPLPGSESTPSSTTDENQPEDTSGGTEHEQDPN